MRAEPADETKVAQRRALQMAGLKKKKKKEPTIQTEETMPENG